MHGYILALLLCQVVVIATGDFCLVKVIVGQGEQAKDEGVGALSLRLLIRQQVEAVKGLPELA